MPVKTQRLIGPRKPAERVCVDKHPKIAGHSNDIRMFVEYNSILANVYRHRKQQRHCCEKKRARKSCYRRDVTRHSCKCTCNEHDATVKPNAQSGGDSSNGRRRGSKRGRGRERASKRARARERETRRCA